MNVDRRGFAKSLTGAVGALVTGSGSGAASPAQAPAAVARAQSRLPPAMVTKIRVFYPPNYDRNGAQVFPQSNMVVLVDTDAGITGIGQGGSPDTVRNVARSVIGRNAFDTEMIWQGERPVPYMPEFLECRNGKVWPNDRPGLGISVDEKQLTLVETMTESAPGSTQRRLDGSLTHW